jgi:hypothetical protein
MATHLLVEFGAWQMHVPEGEILERFVNATNGVEYVHRALQDVGEMSPANGCTSGWGQRIEIIVDEAVVHLTADNFQRRPDRSRDRFDESGFAAAGFACNAIDLVLAHMHRDPVDSPYLAVDPEIFHPVVGAKIARFQDMDVLATGWG